MSYNTKQKELILNIIKKQKSEFTVKDIHKELKDKTGLTTIYRVVDKLVEDKKIRKTISDNNITYYNYLGDCNCSNHIYLKCDKCGEMEHIDCECIKDLTNHIFVEHNFKTSNEHIIINGFCNKCLKESVVC